MKNIFTAALSIITFLSLLTLTSNSFGEDKELMKGDILCLVLDKGKIKALEDFDYCKGLLIFVGMDRKIYTLAGNEDDLQKIAKSPKRMMGYRTPIKIKGSPEGNERAWILYTSHSVSDELELKIERIMSGTVVCIIPNYMKGNAKPVISTAPCYDKTPHLHVLYTDDGKIYALQGTENTIKEMEKAPNKKNLTLKGNIVGNEGGLMLIVEQNII